jgi:hypothetical protein
MCPVIILLGRLVADAVKRLKKQITTSNERTLVRGWAPTMYLNIVTWPANCL